jgi:glycosyltransferase involved in cell wall biosynthesis
VTQARNAAQVRKRLCVVGSSFFFMSGISVYTRTLAQALAKEFDVSVLLLRRLVPRRLYPGSGRVGASLTSLDYEAIPHFDGIDWFWGPSLIRGLRFLFSGQRPDGLILQWWTAAVGHTYVLLAVLARLRRVPVLIEVHEVQDPGEAGRPMAHRYGRLVLRVLLRLSSGVLVHHEHDRKLLMSAGIDPAGKPLAVAPHGPYSHLVALHPVPPPELADTPLSGEVGGCRNILLFGVIRPYKGLEDVVAAFDALPREVAERLVLTVVGETWEGWTVPIEQLQNSRHRDRVRIVNRYVSDAEAAYVFSQTDVLVLPYRRVSSSGPLHIAMAQGLEVIMTDLPALRAVAATYPGAEFIPVADVEALTAALWRAAYRPARRWKPMGDWTLTVDAYRALLGRGARA